MADYGFRAINADTGSIQIDQDYDNLELLEIRQIETQPSETLVPSGQSMWQMYYRSGFSWFKLTRAEASYAFFLGATYITRRGGSGPNGVSGVAYVAQAPAGTIITCYIFGKPKQTIDSGDYGLIVQNKSGEIVFNSNRQYLNIYTILSGSNYLTTFPAATLPSGKTYVFMQSAWSGHNYVDERSAYPGGTMYEYKIEEWGLMIRQNANILASKEEKYIDYFGTDFRTNWGVNYNHDAINRTWAIVIADVTNYVNPL